MKNIKWIFVSFLFIQSILFLRAEDYQPMVLEGNRWNTFHYQYISPYGFDFDVTESLWINGDTVINGMEYKKLFWHTSIPYEIDKLWGFIREDNLTKKIYTRYLDNIERLLYDFSVDEGDTIKLNEIDIAILHIIKSVDHLKVGENYHRRLMVESKIDHPLYEEFPGMIYEWIEGIGGNGGLLNSNIPYGEYGSPIYNLLCFYKEGSFYYKPENIKYDDCYIDYYFPIIQEEGQMWNVLEISQAGLSDNSLKKTHIFTVQGVTFASLFRTTDSLTQNKELVGFLQENRITRKVYWSTEGDPKYLLYDFDVVAGDIIKTYNYDYKTNTIELEKPVDIIVESVDSVLIDNTYRKRVNIKSKFTDSDTDEFTHYTWIEGVGGTNGLLTSFQPKTENDTISYDLLCYYENEELIYQPETGYPDCFIWEPGLGISGKNTVAFKLYFDNTNKVLHINTGQGSGYTIHLFDLQGRIAFSGQYDSREAFIDLSIIPSGIYLARIISNTYTYTTKIISS